MRRYIRLLATAPASPPIKPKSHPGPIHFEPALTGRNPARTGLPARRAGYRLGTGLHQATRNGHPVYGKGPGGIS